MAYSNGRKVYTFLGAILVLLIFLNYLGALSPVKNLLLSLVSPLIIRSNELGIKTAENFRYFKNRQEFFDAYNEMEKELTDFELISSKLKIAEMENAELKKQLSFRERSALAQITARVIGKNADSADQTIIIDQGTEAGIKDGQPVIVGDGIFIGRVAKAEKYSSIVRLINDNQVKVAATILNHDQSLGVVEGGFGLSVRMSFIPRNEVIQVGDQIITSGLDVFTPRGLLIGTVAAIENEPYQPFQQAVISPAVELAKISLVAVILVN